LNDQCIKKVMEIVEASEDSHTSELLYALPTTSLASECPESTAAQNQEGMNEATAKPSTTPQQSIEHSKTR